MWQYIVVPIVAAAVAQLLKVALASSRTGELGWRQLWAYGGMPSMHAALTVSLCTVLFLGEGPSATWAASVVFTFLVLNDALLLRRQVGQHARVLNKLVDQLPDEAEYSYPILALRVGHTLPEILAGAGLGAALALLLWWI